MGPLGKAYTFYTQRVSLNPEKWSLQKFFTELFNYCFPIDFCNQQCTKLHNFVQGNKSVREYVADLDELFTIVGADSKRAWVVKLFNGFQAPLRKALLCEHLNPEHTSWKAMVREAKYQEMAENEDVHKTNNQLSQHKGTGYCTLGKEEHKELKAASKCFICKKDGHFSQNCPDKSRQTSKGNKPPGISANSIRFHESVDLEQTKQLRINSLGETTTSLSIGMVKIGKIGEYMDDVLWGYVSEKEYNSEGDTIPDLQSRVQCHDADTGKDKETQECEDLPVDDDHEEVLLGPPAHFDRVYPAEVEDGEEKILLIEMEEGPLRRLGHAMARKAEYLLELLQPYPGDLADILQYQERRFIAYIVDEGMLLIHDRIFNTFVNLEQQCAENVSFPIGKWYADIRHAHTRVAVKECSRYQTSLIVNSDCWNARKVLASGAPYPWDDK
ncbi:hypothetical protein C0992_003704 [Termitomyces sp. T32_za158]|nr:hypothetical protein C0992_003704 [Termitomyces sp. T32_za158]